MTFSLLSFYLLALNRLPTTYINLIKYTRFQTPFSQKQAPESVKVTYLPTYLPTYLLVPSRF